MAEPNASGPATPAPAPAQDTEAASRPRRSRLRWPLLLGAPLIVLVVAGYIWLNAGRYAETDNAYVKAHSVAVSPAVAGPIDRVVVAENQRVRAGDVVYVLDDEIYRLARDRARAQLETVQSFLLGLEASWRQAHDQLVLAQNDVDYARRDVEREQALAERGLGSESDLDDARHDLDTARLQVPIIEHQIAQLEAQLGGSGEPSLESHSAYRTAKAALDDAETELARTVVRAPIDGIVSHVPLAGGYGTPGAPVLSIVATEGLWVEANFKETQLTHVEVGQPVVVRVDTYPDVELTGRVESISPATGAEFSVIPAQNASGNWVKVAQRIPVRIRLDDTGHGVTLRAGMSALVEIDTGFTREAPAFLGFLQHPPTTRTVARAP